MAEDLDRPWRLERRPTGPIAGSTLAMEQHPVPDLAPGEALVRVE